MDQQPISKQTDFSSLLADVDFDTWDEDDSFCNATDDDDAGSEAKRLKTS